MGGQWLPDGIAWAVIPALFGWAEWLTVEHPVLTVAALAAGFVGWQKARP